MLVAVVAGVLLTGCGGGGGPVRQTDLGLAAPPVTVTITWQAGWEILLVSSSELEQLDVYFADGTSERYALDGLLETVQSARTATISYLRASGKGGDYWYFDSYGAWLPFGYQPKFGAAVTQGEKSASAVWVDDVQLKISSSDTYSEVKVAYDDDSLQTFQTSAMSGTYDLHIAGENVAAIRITLQSDDSKWYFDRYGNTLAQGSKWYQDMD